MKYTPNDDKNKYSSLIGIIIVVIWAVILLFIMLSKLKSVSTEYKYNIALYTKEEIIY